MIESGNFRDHVMLMTICNMHKIKVPLLWAQIEKQFCETFFKSIGSAKGVPADQANEIVSIYTFEFARAKIGDQIWEDFIKFIKEKAINKP